MSFVYRPQSKMRAKIAAVVISSVCILYFLLTGDIAKQVTPADNSLISQWSECMSRQMKPLRGDHAQIWNSIPSFVNACSSMVKGYNVSRLVNKDEAKFHIFPKKGDLSFNTTLLTLGVGTDVEAEKQLKGILKEKAELFGADPIVEINEGLYSKVGSFFPFAVGAEAGMSTAFVLENGKYKDKTVVHIDFLYFLTKVLKRKFFDALWLDAENAEYDMFPSFARNAEIDQNDITFCQINMEVHSPDAVKKRKAHDYFFQLVEDKRYAMTVCQAVGHHRIYMINLSNGECQRRYDKRVL